MLQEAQAVEPKLFGSNIESEKILVSAYSLSKMTLGDEMADFDSYQKMQMCEFYEFLARWAHYLYQDLKAPLNLKVQKLLEVLLA